MADYPAPVVQSRQPPVNATLIVYALFAIAAIVGIVGHGFLIGAPLFTILGIIGVVIAYVSRGDARGTWLESHMSWLIRTFWWSLFWNCLGWLIFWTLVWILIGAPIAWAIWIATTIWVIYRVVKGYLRFHQSQPVSGL
ncbi:MAG TPA: hypothetical protein VFS06_13285 [Casimicrobiaceae bacterium]|jgi:uncharacterized membrane protein|nr:hypothetical protein [Casimicrobiaceae bacterium]